MVVNIVFNDPKIFIMQSRIDIEDIFIEDIDLPDITRQVCQMFGCADDEIGLLHQSGVIDIVKRVGSQIIKVKTETGVESVRNIIAVSLFDLRENDRLHLGYLCIQDDRQCGSQGIQGTLFQVVKPVADQHCVEAFCKAEGKRMVFHCRFRNKAEVVKRVIGCNIKKFFSETVVVLPVQMIVVLN